MTRLEQGSLHVEHCNTNLKADSGTGAAPFSPLATRAVMLSFISPAMVEAVQLLSSLHLLSPPLSLPTAYILLVLLS